MNSSYSIPRKKYHQIYNELIEAKSWLESLNINIVGTRFDEVLTNVGLINSHFKDGTLKEFREKVGGEILYYSLTESAAFINVYQYVKKLKSHQIKRGKLKEMLGGPFLPREETPGSDNINSRNILFELELAANLLKRGIEVLGFEDIQFEHDHYMFHVQCKRPFSKDNIATNIKEAYSQLQPFLNNSNMDKGLIALSIEKIFNIDDKVLEVKHPNEVFQSTLKITQKFCWNYDEIWRKYTHPRFIGVILVTKLIVDIDNLLSSGYYIDIVPLNTLNNLLVSEQILIQSLAKKLGAKTI